MYYGTCLVLSFLNKTVFFIELKPTKTTEKALELDLSERVGQNTTTLK